MAEIIHIERDVKLLPRTVTNTRYESGLWWCPSKEYDLLTYEHVTARVQFGVDFRGDMFLDIP
jgi:hypothetical protein